MKYSILATISIVLVVGIVVFTIALSRPVIQGPVYTIKQIEVGLREHPAMLVGRTVFVQGQAEHVRPQFCGGVINAVSPNSLTGLRKQLVTASCTTGSPEEMIMPVQQEGSNGMSGPSIKSIRPLIITGGSNAGFPTLKSNPILTFLSHVSVVNILVTPWLRSENIYRIQLIAPKKCFPPCADAVFR